MNSDQGKYLYTLYTHTQVHTLHFTYRSQITKEKPREYFDIKKKKLCKKLQLNSQATKWNSILILYI